MVKPPPVKKYWVQRQLESNTPFPAFKKALCLTKMQVSEANSLKLLNFP